jgi:predicted N-acyltransferase
MIDTDNFHFSHLSNEEYLDIREKERMDYDMNYFNAGYASNDDFLQNFMKIDYDNSIFHNRKVSKAGR